VEAVFFLGRRLGELIYSVALRQRQVVYANLKRAFGGELAPRKISRLTRKFYRGLGQNLAELFLIPRMDSGYMRKYVQVEGAEYPRQALERNKGLVLTSVHSGSWELQNLICNNLGLNFTLFIREQRYARTSRLLNSWRRQSGFAQIERGGFLRGILRALKANRAIGMNLDQGGRGGVEADFFGSRASMSAGAVSLALRHDTPLVPAFYSRVKGPYFKIVFLRAFELSRSADPEIDIKENLQALVKVFEQCIRSHPEDYFWAYKIWKYGRQKRILILSDGKAGHLRQSQAAARILSACLKERGEEAQVSQLQIEFKNPAGRFCLALCGLYAGKYGCQGCLLCLRKLLLPQAYAALAKENPDFVISCGASLAAANYIISSQNASRSIVLMRPGTLPVSRFDLAIIPRHDSPPRRKNIVATDAALNLVNEAYLREHSDQLLSAFRLSPFAFYIGLLLGGDNKDFRLSREAVSALISQLKYVAEKTSALILATTSRRTPQEAEGLLKQELGGDQRCGLMVIANEKNIPSAVGGILGLSSVAVVSPESISMISEAANSGKYVVVFQQPGLGRRHRLFLENLAAKKIIYLCAVDKLAGEITRLLREKPAVRKTEDNAAVRAAIGKLI
jgi:lauroyl/myristoyl acyltransferase/mitochondrial fission protein ELM1